MPLFDPRAVLAAANDDAEFKLAARFWTATLRLEAGDSCYILDIRDGAMTAFAPATSSGGSACDLRIAAPEADWRELLKPIPRPFYQDLMAARWRHGVIVEGDLTAFNPYYRAFSRLIELMRAASAG
ncbi:MAG: hypothetical protein ABSG46_12030 [Candidatus Binataceae bacterium]|jgi:hypothetical protein